MSKVASHLCIAAMCHSSLSLWLAMDCSVTHASIAAGPAASSTEWQVLNQHAFLAKSLLKKCTSLRGEGERRVQGKERKLSAQSTLRHQYAPASSRTTQAILQVTWAGRPSSSSSSSSFPSPSSPGPSCLLPPSRVARCTIRRQAGRHVKG